MNWYQKEINQVLSELQTSFSGLSSEESKRRLQKYGFNEIIEARKKTLFQMFLEQFKDFMILVLIFAALIAGFMGEWADTIAIVVIVVLNAIIGFVQEYRAEKAMEALKEMAALTAMVVRGGQAKQIPAKELVPGDIVLLEAGNIVPADLRLIEAVHLKVNEATLTGESVPVEKETITISEKHLPLGDQKNMAFKGTIVTYGRGRGVVVSTGMKTEVGKIATLLQQEEEVKTPLQKRLQAFGKNLSLLVLAICAFIFLTEVLFKGEDLVKMFLVSVSLAVAAIPEALPAVITISLALGAKRMVEHNALVRKLPAVETLGSVTYICSDKTGTLTLNQMKVEEFWLGGKKFQAREKERFESESIELLKSFFLALALSNDAHQGFQNEVFGDPTEVALYTFAKENGFDRFELEKKYPRIAEIPFDSARKCMTTIHKKECRESGAEEQGKSSVEFHSFTKGAVEVVLKKAKWIRGGEGLINITPEVAEAINRAAEEMAADGLRVLCLAERKLEEFPEEIKSESLENDLTIIALVGLLDPPREEARAAVEECKTAGIKPVMITGDHPLTARTIAQRLGIIDEDSEAVITGQELEELSLEEFEKHVEHIKVYARVAPEQKLKIVKALQDKGQFVAMTGDGVNDAPALKRADIGVAMGITGTDVAKEASHMILLDDNFNTIVKAVKEGRRIFDNIRKFIKYTMTSNSAEIWTIFLAPFFGLPIPLLPIHILWINLVTDGLPGLALSAEPAEKDVMKRPPRHPKESIFAHGMGAHMLWVGLLMGFVSIFSQAWSITNGNSHWQTIVFSVLCLSQMGHVLAIRSEKESLFKQGVLSNKPLIGAFLLTLVSQMAVIYLPFLNPIFKTQPLSLGELLFVLCLSSVVFIVVELEKLFKRLKSK